MRLVADLLEWRVAPADLAPFALGQRVEAPRLGEGVVDQRLRNTVVLQVKEADRPADFAELGCDRLDPARTPFEVGREVEGRNLLGRIRMVDEREGFRVVGNLTPDIANVDVSHGGHPMVPSHTEVVRTNTRKRAPVQATGALPPAVPRVSALRRRARGRSR